MDNKADRHIINVTIENAPFFLNAFYAERDSKIGFGIMIIEL